MELRSGFSFGPPPTSTSGPVRFGAPASSSPLGPLAALPGSWSGAGFNVIWTPLHGQPSDHFLQLNVTEEILEVQEIAGAIPNRGLLQGDISMYGVTYLGQIKDSNRQLGLHMEPGIWATVPQTDDPAVPPTVVRMASIPHGTAVLAQGVASSIVGPPTIGPVSITPFSGQPSHPQPFSETNLSQTSSFRTDPGFLAGVEQWMLDNPNEILTRSMSGQTIKTTTVLDVSSLPVPVPGGRTANTAFLEGVQAPNARADVVSSTFWIEVVQGTGGAADFLQLQYSQTVLLTFNDLVWPHVSVGTLKKAG